MKILSVFLLALSLFPLQTHALYEQEIDDCIRKNALGQAKTISEYICPGGKLSGGKEMKASEIAYQVILDLEFKKIDKKLEAELKKFQKEKSIDVAAIALKISNWFDEDRGADPTNYWQQYRKVCNDMDNPNSPIRAVMKNYELTTTDGKTLSFLPGNNECATLIRKKMTAYRTAAWIFAQKNIVKSFREDKHDFMSRLKAKYQRFLMKMTIFIAHITRINDNWNAKVRKQNGQ